MKDVDMEARAKRATANLKTHWLSLHGPAEVMVMAPLEEIRTSHRPSPRRPGWGRWLACGLLALFGTPALAQPPPAAQEQPAPAGAKKSSSKKVVADVGEGGTLKANFKTNAFQARKNVVVTIPEDEVTIWCDKADYTGDEGEKKGILTASGNLRMKDPENELKGDLLTVYTEEKRAVLTGHVVLVHTPKDKPPEGEKGRADEYRYSPTTVTCDKVEYWYKTGQRKGIATGNLKFQQKDRNGTAEKATFYNEDQIVDLEGKVLFEDPTAHRKLEAPLVRVLLEEDEILITGPVKFEFILEEEGEGGAAPGPEEQPPSGPQAPPLPGFEEEGGGSPGPEGGTGGGEGTPAPPPTE
jgi:lipopolysaccharide export system protein LptA